MSQGREVLITTYAPAELIIDGESMGQSPFRGTLSYGKHEVIAVSEKTFYGLLEITETGETDFFVKNGVFSDKDISNPESKLLKHKHIFANGKCYFFRIKNQKHLCRAYDFYTKSMQPLSCYGSTGMGHSNVQYSDSLDLIIDKNSNDFLYFYRHRYNTKTKTWQYRQDNGKWTKY